MGMEALSCAQGSLLHFRGGNLMRLLDPWTARFSSSAPTPGQREAKVSTSRPGQHWPLY